MTIIASSLIDPIRKLNFYCRSIVSQNRKFSLLYTPYMLWDQVKRKASNRDLKEGLLLPDTELVIDGFQGSANSFATVAFKHFQTKPVRLMHHRHAPILIIQAIKQQVPVLLTIREPVGAVMSLTSRWPYVSVTQALKSYIGFYTQLKPYSSHYVVSTFEQTTQHLDQVIHTINMRFGTHFDLVDVERANLECRNRVSDTPDRTAKRQAVKQQKQKELSIQRNQNLLEKATKLYESYEEYAQQNIKN